jgi:hypothetical protein
MSRPSRLRRSPLGIEPGRDRIAPALDVVRELFDTSADHSADDDYLQLTHPALGRARVAPPDDLGWRMAAHQDPHAVPVHLGKPTAGAMPRLRDHVADACRRSYTAEYLDSFIDQLRHHDPRQTDMLTRVNMKAADVIRWLHTAELFFVTDAMTAMCAQAARSMPPYNLRPDDVPSHVGFMVWAEPVVTMDAAQHWEERGLPGAAWCHTRAVLWSPCETRVGPGVLVSLWADTAALLTSPRYQLAEVQQPGLLANIAGNMGPLVCYDAVPLPYGIGYDHENHEQIRVQYQPIAAVLSTWLIMQQRIAVTTQQRADYPVRQEYRAARRPEPTVRHITLRHTYTVADPDKTPTATREYHHRWYSVGHWRFLDRERYPDKTPTWVVESVKGPEGAPFIGGERVHVLRR